MSLSTQSQHNHSLHRLALAMATLLVCLSLAPYGHAQEPASSPEEQCLKGAQLFFDENDHAGALPFLEAGFTGRTARPFQNLSYLAYCSYALGAIRNANRDFAGALEAYTVAEETFRQGPERQWDVNIQYGLGQANYYLGRFAAAEAAYLNGLAIARERNEEFALLPIAKDLISLYGDQGRYEEAIAIYEQLTPQQREQIGLDANSLNILGANYRSLGRYTEARTAHEEALRLARDQRDRLGEASSLKLLAQVYQSQGQFAEARTRLNQALEIYGDEPGGRASTFSDLGLLEVEAGRLGAALTYFEQALASIPPDDMVPVRDLRATIISNRAMTFVAQGQYEAARVSFDAAQKLYKANGNQERIAITSINLGALAEREANRAARGEDRDRLNEQALAQYQAALTIIDAQSLRPLRVLTLNNIGALLSKLERSAEATSALTESLAIARELKNPRDTAIALVNLADIDQLQGRYAEALVRYDEALALAREAGSQGVEVEALAHSARTLQLQGNASAALPRYEQALAVLGQLRAVAGADAGRSGFSANYADIYERAARLYLAQGNPAGAFATVERGRARVFLDSLAAGDIQLADQARNVRAERFRTAQAVLEAVHAELALVRRSDPPDQDLIARLEVALAQAENEHHEALAALQRDGAQAALFLADGPAVGELAALQEQLPANTALLAFQVGTETTLTFVVTRGTVTARELSIGREQLSSDVRALLSFDGAATDTSDRASRLYTTLIAPIREQLTTTRLIIVPHGVLHYVPFALLSADGQRLLNEDFQLSLLPAAALLPYVQQPFQTGAGVSALVMANANLGGESPVPGVEEAAERIGSLFGVRPLLGEQATVAALSAGANQAQIIHLGAHGAFDLANPLRSNIQLYSGDAGRLTVEGVYRLPLQDAALVTLSACETQLNQLADPTAPIAVTAGDDIVGLQRAFFVAGARNVVTTLWEVPEEASVLLMETFYQAIREGAEPIAALQQAQQQVRSAYPDDPRAWAGFVLSGVGDAPLIELPWWQRVPWWGWALGSGMLLGFVIAGMLWWHRQIRSS